MTCKSVDLVNRVVSSFVEEYGLAPLPTQVTQEEAKGPVTTKGNSRVPLLLTIPSQEVGTEAFSLSFNGVAVIVVSPTLKRKASAQPRRVPDRR